MAISNNKTILFILEIIFPVISIAVVLIPGLVAWFTVGFKIYFNGLGYVFTSNLVGLIVFAILWLILVRGQFPASYSIGKLPNSLDRPLFIEVCFFNSAALFLSLLLSGCLILVAYKTAKVIILEVSSSEQLTMKRIEKMVEILDDNDKVILIFTTEEIMKRGFSKLSFSEDLVNKLRYKDLSCRDRDSVNKVMNVLDQVGFSCDSSCKSLGTIYAKLKTNNYSGTLLNHAGGCLMWLFLNNESQFGAIPNIDSYKQFKV